MINLWASGALVLFMIVSPALGEPSPKPRIAKDTASRPQKENARGTQRPSEASTAVGLFLLQLQTDGSVRNVVVVRTTGDKVLDAWTAGPLWHTRFKPEQLTKEQWTKKEVLVPVPVTKEDLKTARYLPKPDPRTPLKQQFVPLDKAGKPVSKPW
jgi:hypothetical protein